MAAWYQVIPRRLTYTNVGFWLGIWNEDLPDDVIEIRFSTRNGLVRNYFPPTNSWMKRGTPAEKRVWHRWVEFSGLQLQPETEFKGELLVGGNVKAAGIGRTLPNRIPLKKNVEDGLTKPFTIFVGSCYLQRNDPDSKVSNAFMRLWRNPFLSPDIKFLCGDQIYFDNPYGDFIAENAKDYPFRNYEKWFRERLTNKYRRTWNKLSPLLSHGATYMMSDDHEYWNDYPYNTGAPWIFGMQPIASYLTYIKKKTEQFAEAFQITHLNDTFKVGEDLDFFILDTRRNRSLVDDTFANPNDFASAMSWVRNLKSPGLLIMSSPIFVPRKNYVEEWYLFDYIGDHNLPYFENQFIPLAHALLESKVDIVVISGDPHFSRTAIAEIGGSNPHKIVEVISSAMATIDDAPGDPKPGPNFFPLPRQKHPTIQSATVQYRKYSRINEDEERAVDNFVTVGFVRLPDGGIEMHVRSWMHKRLDNSQNNVPIDFEDSIVLYGENRPLAKNNSWLVPVITVLNQPQ